MSTGVFSCAVSITLPGVGEQIASGKAGTPKDAKTKAAEVLLQRLAKRGIATEPGPATLVAAGGTESPAAKRLRLAPGPASPEAWPIAARVTSPGLIRPGQVVVTPILATPIAAELEGEGAGELVPAAVGWPAAAFPNPVGKNPLMLFNEFCQKSKAKCEWVCNGGQGSGSWTATAVVKTTAGELLGCAEAEAASKRDAQVAAAVQFLASQGFDAAAPVFPVAPAAKVKRSAPAAVGLVRPGQIALKAPPSSAEDGAGGCFGSLDQPPPAPLAIDQEMVEGTEATFGYTAATARARLSEYLVKRQLPTDIPTTNSGPPFTASLEIPLARGRGSVWGESRATTKKDALKAVALKLIVELCKVGEVPPWAKKDSKEGQGIVPAMASIKPGIEEQLDTLFSDLGVAVNYDGVATAKPSESIMQDFDAQPWSTYPHCRAITWSPPRWGFDPWSGQESASTIDEDGMNEKLKKELEEREASISYASVKASRAMLPITAMTDQILHAIDNNSVTLIAGSTGCGKTTQLPQLLLERASRGGFATKTNVVCTQPRRIAAITVAERVARERCEQAGQSCGYRVRFHTRVPRGFASVCYMTTGMLLRCLVSSGLNGVSHLIIDEVHERDLDTDFLLTIVRILLPNSPGLRVILMSATMDLDKWSSYFGTQGFCVVEIPGRLFPVDIYHLEDAQRMVGMAPGSDVKWGHEEIPIELCERLITSIVSAQGCDGRRGAVLVFFPGWDSIDTMNKRLNKSRISRQIKVYCLHSKVPKDEQQSAFSHAPEGIVKVVLSTNIAESSVTISDVVYVIDTCRVKQLVPIHSALGRTSYRLTNVPASKQNLQQRAGRAGRVQHGVCYRLISRATFETLPYSLNPEMVRLPLHQVCLTVKSLNLGTCSKFLGMAPDAPHAQSVRHAVKMLMDLKAFDSRERITSLGLKLAKLPIEPRMGFALLASCLLGLGEPLAVLSAFVNSPPLFYNEQKRSQELEQSGDQVASMLLLSDHLDALQTYYKMKDLASYSIDSACRQNFINPQSFRHIVDVTDQTLQILNQMDFPPETTVSCKEWILQLGTSAETDAHRQLWSAVMFLLGLGVEHFALRMGAGRKVYIGPSKKEGMKTSQMAVSAGIPECCPMDVTRPFVLFAELRESDWSSTCRNVSCAGSISTILGAARDLSYDNVHQCLLVDGWAPVQMSANTAARMVSTRLALRSCLLNISKSPSLLATNTAIANFKGLLFELVHPWDPLAEASPLETLEAAAAALEGT